MTIFLSDFLHKSNNLFTSAHVLNLYHLLSPGPVPHTPMQQMRQGLHQLTAEDEDESPQSFLLILKSVMTESYH